ncbi:hypothetical protein QUC32_13075 [Novosphingobium resinovorum]|uniref:hypothetical protein n=1 Tax=Novosphingobium TaxID=165696 RepID=UPI001B3C8EA9|nr:MULTISPECIES: hypothetical protein [Novosphingobium]MBF7010610.1 hypothetical protein [Novosphingobium sp. HR1a]WJM28607.1 hypothetical protein QUC32_13075 [Novosphingobium resinovorum]
MSVRPETSDMIDFLNDLLDLDPKFVRELIAHRPQCNDAIADHPTVQAGLVGNKFVSGFLGVVNGFLGTIETGKYAGWGPIAVVYDDNGIAHFVATSQLPSS